MSAKAIDVNPSGCLVVILPMALALAVLFTAWPLILGMIVVGGGLRVWQNHQWQQLSQQVYPTFRQLVEENRGSVTPMDLALKANLSGPTAKRFLDTKAEQFGAQQREYEDRGTVYYFITSSTLGGILDDSEPAISHTSQPVKEEQHVESLTDEELAAQAAEKKKYPQALIQSELAKRLDVHSSTVMKQRDREYFSEWSQSRDPEGIAWKYSPKTRLFLPVK